MNKLVEIGTPDAVECLHHLISESELDSDDFRMATSALAGLWGDGNEHADQAMVKLMDRAEALVDNGICGLSLLIGCVETESLPPKRKLDLARWALRSRHEGLNREGYQLFISLVTSDDSPVDSKQVVRELRGVIASTAVSTSAKISVVDRLRSLADHNELAWLCLLSLAVDESLPGEVTAQVR